MKDKRVDDLIGRVVALERRCDVLERKYNGLNEQLKRNRCVDEYWDIPVFPGVWHPFRGRVDLPFLAKQFNALVERLGLEWRSETSQAGFQEKAEEKIGEKEKGE